MLALAAARAALRCSATAASRIALRPSAVSSVLHHPLHTAVAASDPSSFHRRRAELRPSAKATTAHSVAQAKATAAGWLPFEVTDPHAKIDSYEESVDPDEPLSPKKLYAYRVLFGIGVPCFVFFCYHSYVAILEWNAGEIEKKRKAAIEAGTWAVDALDGREIERFLAAKKLKEQQQQEQAAQQQSAQQQSQQQQQQPQQVQSNPGTDVTRLPRADAAAAESPVAAVSPPLIPAEVHAANTARLAQLHADARSIFQAALDAADPRRMILSHLTLRPASNAADSDSLSVHLAPGRSLLFDLSYFHRIVVVGAGKAAPAMASGVESVLGSRITEGIVVTKAGGGGVTNDAQNKPLQRVQVREAAHPVPDDASIDATQKVAAMLAKYSADPRTLLIVLISGGGSALWTAPESGLTLQDIQSFNRAVLHGAHPLPIHDINILRKHIDSMKGGGLLHRAGQAQVLSLILSDVIGDDLGVIASGPTVPFERDYVQALQILDRYNLRPNRVEREVQRRVSPAPSSTDFPLRVYEHLLRHAKSQVQQNRFQDLSSSRANGEFSCPSSLPAFDAASAPPANVTNVLVGSNRQSLEAAAHRARELGYAPEILTDRLDGEASVAAEWITRAAIPVHDAATAGSSSSGFSSHSPTPRAWLAGGETTVTFAPSPGVPTGLGGRNQELALAAALHLHRHEVADSVRGECRTVVLSGGTDGTDGPTDATGAIVDARTVTRGKQAGLDAAEYLARHDSYSFFRALDAAQAQRAHSLGQTQPPSTHLRPGPTGTNVGDVQIALVR